MVRFSLPIPANFPLSGVVVFVGCGLGCCLSHFADSVHNLRLDPLHVCYLTHTLCTRLGHYHKILFSLFFSANELSRFASVVVGSVLGTSAPKVAHPSVFLILCISRTNARGESKALEGLHFSLKKPFKGHRQRRGSCWEEWKRKEFIYLIACDPSVYYKHYREKIGASDPYLRCP